MSHSNKSILLVCSCKWSDISSTPRMLIWTSQDKIPLAVPVRFAYVFALRVRNVDADLNPKPFLQKPAHRVMQKSVVLTVPFMLRRLSAVFVYHLPQQRKWQMWPFFLNIFFTGNRDAALTSSLSFPVPERLFCAGHAASPQGSHVGQVVRCGQWNSFKGRRGGHTPTRFRSVWGYQAWY